MIAGSRTLGGKFYRRGTAVTAIGSPSARASKSYGYRSPHAARQFGEVILEGDPVVVVVVRLVGQGGAVWPVCSPSEILLFGGVRDPFKIEIRDPHISSVSRHRGRPSLDARRHGMASAHAICPSKPPHDASGRSRGHSRLAARICPTTLRSGSGNPSAASVSRICCARSGLVDSDRVWRSRAPRQRSTRSDRTRRRSAHRIRCRSRSGTCAGAGTVDAVVPHRNWCSLPSSDRSIGGIAAIRARAGPRVFSMVVRWGPGLLGGAGASGVGAPGHWCRLRCVGDRGGGWGARRRGGGWAGAGVVVAVEPLGDVAGDCGCRDTFGRDNFCGGFTDSCATGSSTCGSGRASRFGSLRRRGLGSWCAGGAAG
jgi:hypothetical protein